VFVRVAPFLFVLLWSSSFIAAKTGLRDISPLLFVAIRLVGCALVLVAAMLLCANRGGHCADGAGCIARSPARC